MTVAKPHFTNAPAARFELEPFRDYAFQALEACPLVAPGVCTNPMCSQPFAPVRPWQIYCSRLCRKSDEAELRRIGHKAAPALLAWRAGKYEKTDPSLQALSRAGRNYVSQLSSEWWRDRQTRAQAAQIGRSENEH